MTKEEAIKTLEEAQNNFDTENAHRKADGVLCKLLESLGYEDVVNEWCKVEKWYS